MSEFFGDGTSRTLSARARQFVNVVWQKGKPPLDSELNLVAQINEDAQQAIVSSSMSSGWIGNVVNPMSDYDFDPQASNMFWLGKEISDSEGDALWANVNGWLIPVIGTRSSDSRNAILLPPPKTDVSDSDVNFVFLEVWKAQISPDGPVNKPAPNLLYRYGNAEYGGTNLTNDLLDPAILFETTERVQLQYRLRVVDSDPVANPHGFGPQIRGQATLDNPTTSTNPAYQFHNMGDELGDPGLWRAGTGNPVTDALGTVDGYVYAIPLCFVFRRTRNDWAFTQQTGATDRNPTMTDRLEASVLPTIRLTEDIGPEDLTLQVDTTQGSTTLAPGGGLIRINSEILAYSSYSGTTIQVSERGARDTHATSHAEDSMVGFVSGHPLGLFSDQIVADDVLDLRHMISTDGLDYDGLLQQNFSKLLKGELASGWKKSAASVKGRKHFQVDHFGPDNNAPDITLGADRPDGFRKIFSDASVPQPNNLAVLGSAAGSSLASDLTFNPTITILRAGAASWEVNDAVVMGLEQFRSTVPMANNRKVRFVHPFEYDDSDHFPTRLWFGEVDPTSMDAQFEGALTLDSQDSDPWFMVLGEEAEIPDGLTNGQNDIDFDPTGVLEIGAGITFTPDDLAALLAQDAWIVITPGTAAANVDPQNRGAYRIVGLDGSGNLIVEKADGTAPTDFAGTTNRQWALRLPRCSEDDDNMTLVLVRDPASNSTLSFTYDLLYHPVRGLSRAPDTALHVEMHTTSSNYIRETTFRNLATSPNRTVKKSPAVPLASYPHLHNKEMQVRNQQDVASHTETVWSEAYVDRGSKTLVFQPVRNITTRMEPRENPATLDYDDPTGIFNLIPNDPDACILIPKELRASLGRIDLPFIKSVSPAGDTSTSAAYGINHLLHSGSTGLNVANLVSQRVRFLYAPDDTGPGDFGSWANILALTGQGPSDDALVCRFYDRGGVRGIEIPAHYGIARLFAAHFLADYDGSSIFSGPGFRSLSAVDRINLLREDNDRRSLIITDENTFVITEDVLDLDTLEDQTLVFEAATFFFDDWSSDFMRVHRVSGPGFTFDSSDFRLYVNGPVETGQNFYLVSTRVPYQGSIYGTMPRSSDDTNAIEFTDYDPKRNTERPSDIVALLGEMLEEPRVENPGSLEILASLPFATTLGTGVVSGPVVEGSYTDIGYLSLENFPFEASPADDRKVFSRSHPPTAPALSEALAGLSERLPLGLIVSDYQFIGEGLGQDYKRFWTPNVSIDAGGDYRYDKLLSQTLRDGTLVFADGTSAKGQYGNSRNMYRTYRGGTVMSEEGGAVVLTGGREFKDLSYLSSPDARHLKMHGAVLFGMAFLVRNAQESVTDSEVSASFGDELQMLVVTGITLGKELDLSGNIAKEFVDLLVQLHPRGVGEGFCAADRFRIEGRPLQKTMRNRGNGIQPFLGRDPTE